MVLRTTFDSCFQAAPVASLASLSIVAVVQPQEPPVTISAGLATVGDVDVCPVGVRLGADLQALPGVTPTVRVLAGVVVPLGRR